MFHLKKVFAQKIFTQNNFHPKKIHPKNFTQKNFHPKNHHPKSFYIILKYSIIRISFVDLRWAQLYVSLVIICFFQRKEETFISLLCTWWSHFFTPTSLPLIFADWTGNESREDLLFFVLATVCTLHRVLQTSHKKLPSSIYWNWVNLLSSSL